MWWQDLWFAKQQLLESLGQQLRTQAGLRG